MLQNLKNSSIEVADIQVLTTNNYGLFALKVGNRAIDPLHVKRIKKSMAEKLLFTVIIANESYEIIDGQHRFTALKELGEPIYFIIAPGYEMKDVHRINTNSRNWKSLDFMQGYINEGRINYKLFDEFQKKYGFCQHEIILLFGVSSNANNSAIFREGNLRIVDYNKACERAEKILALEPYYHNVRRRNFVQAMIDLLKNPKFDYDRFVKKLKLQPTALKDCTTVVLTKEMIETIYNYKSMIKVSLKYDN